MNSIARLFSRRAAVAAGVVALAAGITAPAVLGSNHQKASSRPGFTGKVQNLVLSDTANGNSASFAIELKAQADLSKAYTMKDQDARGWYVYKTLKAEAARRRRRSRHTSTRSGVNYRSFWVSNVIFVRGRPRRSSTSLAGRADVKQIEANDASYWLDTAPQARTRSPRDAPRRTAVSVEWGVTMVHAPDLWAMGFTGQGIVDRQPGHRHALDPPGAQAALPRLERHAPPTTTTTGTTRSTATSTATALNACGFNSMQPCDDHGHGTHTTGTSARRRRRPDNQIGVAPGAKWIGCRNMDAGNGRPRPTSSASSSSSRRPTSAARTPTRPSAPT